MKLVNWGFSYWVTLCLFNTNPVAAQIEGDNTLPINSDVIKNGINFEINGGTPRGNNLFHSFKKFNVPTVGEAFFNNSNSIENIFTRITGGSISHIDGVIRANGSANLFFMNPNGIIFGENARLNIGGSFFGTTAESIQFTKSEFSAINPQAPPLLKINVPVGLQFGENPQKITVNPQTQLEVKPRNTLALIAGDIDINGGILKSAQGNIELGSVNSGIVNINSSKVSPGLTFSYEDVASFQDINLQQAFLDTSGFGGGFIRLQGRNITLNKGSQVLIQNFGFQKAGNIEVNASETFQLSGTNADNTINTSLINQTFGKGDGGDIAISTQRLQIQDGAIIETRTYSDAKGGNLDINSSELVQINGFSQFNPSFVSGINAAALSSGNAGDIALATANLSIEDGANVTSITLGTGNGGNINVDADTVNLVGYNAIVNQPSLLSASTTNAGNAGNLIVNTSKLNISAGANLNTSTLASGNSGSIIINASEFVKIDGELEQFGFLIRSNVNSSGTILPENVQQLLNLPSLPSGASGDVTIQTPELNITNGAEVSVTNQGTGDAGRLYINANSLTLNQKSSLAAATNGGKGGNILLNTENLQLRNNSAITATAKGNGNGGNIEINTDTLVALENSDITANAEDSFGGKVTINTQGVFGIQERSQLTPESDITASSELGASFNGVVKLNTLGINPNFTVVKLPTNVIETRNQISARCAAQRGNNFTVTGKGGLPENPTVKLTRMTLWADLRVPQSTERTSTLENNPISYSPIIEATGFVKNARGEVELVALVPKSFDDWQQISSCKKV